MTSIKNPIAVSLWAALFSLSPVFLSTALHAQSALLSKLNTQPTPAASSLAYARASHVRLIVAPERSDWTYQVGEQVRFKVCASVDSHPLGGVELHYRVGPEMLVAEERSATLPDNGEPLMIDGGRLDVPGFIRCEIKAVVDGRDYKAVGTAGVSPSEIRPTQVEPEDFDEFWASGLAELEKVPLEPEITHLPERSTSAVDVYHVGIRTIGDRNPRVYGILCVPKGDGPFPAVLRVPGAGVRGYPGQIELAKRGVITLEIGIHGISTNLDQEIYKQLTSGLLNSRGYSLIQLDDRDHYYYRRVYLSCIRANDFLVSHPKFDGENLLVMGGSQGGQLSIITAALDRRVKALSSDSPAYCDVTGYLHGRAGGWPHMMRPNDDGSPSAHATEAKLRTTSYYDVVNFSRRLKVPGHYTWGYNDIICPPTSLYAAYNVITAPKKLLLSLELGHEYLDELDVITNVWVGEQLGLKQ